MSGKNMSASIVGKLKNLARDKRVPVQAILNRYCFERFLWRLTESAHANDFALKGGLLMAFYNDGDLLRPTVDIDLSGAGEGDIERLKRVVEDVAAITAEDGVIFDSTCLKVKKTHDGAIPGGKLTFTACVNTAKVNMQIDVGFGNPVDKQDTKMVDLKTLLPDMAPGIRIAAYPLEATIAEKFHAMVRHGAANTRLKDYYDIWRIMDRHELDGAKISRYVNKVFEVFGDDVPNEPPALSSTYASDNEGAWKAFLKKNMLPDSHSYSEVVARVSELLLPIANGAGDACVWLPDSGWRTKAELDEAGMAFSCT